MAYINVDEVYILDNTGLQVDMATDIPFVDAGFTDVQKEQARANIGAGGTNPNLLDNAFFTVNQRSVTSGSNPSSTAVYARDRWKIARCSSYVFNDNGTVTTSWDGTGAGCCLIQYAFAETAAMLRGKTVTLSVYVGGTLYTKTLTLPNQTSNSFVIGDGLSVNIVDVISSGRGYECQFYHSVTAGKTIGPFKLELGSVSTLPSDAPPNYAEELAKCQRYFVRLNYTSVAEPIGYGYAYAASQARILIPTPAPMRADPTISATATANLRINCNGTYLTPSGFTATGTAFPNGIAVHFGISGATSGALALLFSYDTCYIDFSADL